MTVVSGSIHSETAAINVVADLSGTGARLPDSRSIPPNSVSPAILALVDFDSLVRTACLLRAALHVIQLNLPAEFGTVRDGMCSGSPLQGIWVNCGWRHQLFGRGEFGYALFGAGLFGGCRHFLAQGSCLSLEPS